MKKNNNNKRWGSVMLAFEYSADASNLYGALNKLLIIPRRNPPIFLCPYCYSHDSDDHEFEDQTTAEYVRGNSLKSYFEKLGKPRNICEREDLGKVFSAALDAFPRNSERPKKLYFLVTSRYKTCSFDPFEHISCDIDEVHFITIGSMVDVLTPIKESGLFKVEISEIKGKEIRLPVCDFATSIERTARFLAKIEEVVIDFAMVCLDSWNENWTAPISSGYYLEEPEVNVFSKKREAALEIIERFSSLANYLDYRMLAKFKTSFYQALIKRDAFDIRGSFTVIENDERQFSRAIPEIKSFFERNWDIAVLEVDCALFGGHDPTQALVYLFGSTPEYQHASESAAVLANHYLHNEKDGEAIIILKNLNLLHLEAQEMVAKMLQPKGGYVENRFTKRRYDTNNTYFIVTLAPKEKVPSDITLNQFAAEEKNLSPALANLLSAHTVVLEEEISPYRIYVEARDRVIKTCSLFYNDDIDLSCDADEVSQLVFFHNMTRAATVRQAEEFIDEAIVNEIGMNLASQQKKLSQIGKIQIDVQDNGLFSEELKGFVYNGEVSNLFLDVDTWSCSPTRAELIEKSYDYAILFDDERGGCIDLLKTIQALPQSFPVLVVVTTNDEARRMHYLLRGADEAVPMELFAEMVGDFLSAAKACKTYRRFKDSAQHLVFDKEITVEDDYVRMAVHSLHAESYFSSADQKLIDEFSGGVPDMTFEEIIGAEKPKMLLERMASGETKGNSVLFYGPPGTGKTSLAKAYCNKLAKQDARIIFLKLFGSDFMNDNGIQKFRRIFELVKVAPKTKFVLFIDELDALCLRRGTSSHADATRGLLDVFMNNVSGFRDDSQNLTILASTNTLEDLDPAVIRRFDHVCFLDIPKDVMTRKKLVQHYLIKNGLTCNDEAIDQFLARTGGALSPSRIKAVIESAKDYAQKTDLSDGLSEALDDFLFGEPVTVSKQAKERTAYHEAAHAVIAQLLGRNCCNVSIVARACGQGGYTYVSNEQEFYSKKYVLETVQVLLAGMAAERLFLGESGSGASQDLSQASELLVKAITAWGMGRRLLTISDASPTPAQLDEAEEMLRSCLNEAEALVNSQRDLIRTVAEALLEKGTLTSLEIDRIAEQSRT